MNHQDEKFAAKVKGWVYITEGVVAIFGGLFISWIMIPLLPIAFVLFIFVGMLVPAGWFIRTGKRELDKADEF